MVDKNDFRTFWLNLFDERIELDEEDYFLIRNTIMDLKPKDGYPKVTYDDMEAALIWLNKESLPQA